MAEGDPSQAKEAGRLERLGKLRDGLLVLGGGLYVLGYVVWSYYAWRNNLGMLPAIDSQYFIAGLVPALIFLLIGLSILFCWRRAGSVARPFWLDPNAELSGWRRVVRTAVQVLVFAVMVGWPILEMTGLGEKLFPRTYDVLLLCYSGLILLLFFATIFFANPSAREENESLTEWLRRVFGKLFLILVIAALGVVAVFYYVDLLYSQLPQAVGGVRPRCAVLDVAKNSVSRETLAALTPKPAQAVTEGAQPTPAPTPSPSPEVGIVRSAQLDVLYSSGDFVLVRVPAREGEKSKEVFEIKKDAISAVKWCE